MPKISPLAIIEKGAELAEDVVVGPFSHIGQHVKIAAGCVIDNSVTVTGKTAIGENCCISALAVVGASANGAKTQGVCQIGKAVRIREHVTVYAGIDAPTQIGDDNLIMVASIVGAGASLGDHGIFANCTHFAPGAKVEEYVRISAFVTVGAVTLGAYTFVAGYCEIDRDVPPFAMIDGTPYRIRGVNIENLRRCGFSDDDIREIKSAFRELFNGSGGPANQQVLARLSGQCAPESHLQRLCRSLQQMKSLSE
ncbi:MAG: hypothetical protein HZA50_16560 [Planctomycetes bacterium]|nr:hypothetical protein [Planctomycetota bacterium]